MSHGAGPRNTGCHVLVHGASGFGKTRLVLEACHDPAMVGRFDGGILWVTLGEQPDVCTVLQDLYARVVGAEPVVAGTDALAQALAAALSAAVGSRRCLLVVDDVWRAADLRPFLELTCCTLVVTSRLRDVLARAGEVDWVNVPVEEMNVDEGAALLGRGLAVDPAAEKELRLMADQLGCWPLLLGLVNARLLMETQVRHSVSDGLSFVQALFRRRGVLEFDSHDET